MDGNHVPAAAERDPRFPPMVRFRVFVESLERLSATRAEQREPFLAELAENDRSQLCRALDLFGVRWESEQYDEVMLRRLGDPERRPEALRELLQRHYAPELDAIRGGVDNRELEQLLAVEGRDSPSALEKARQFLLRAVAEADLPAAGVRQAGRQLDPQSPAGPNSESSSRASTGTGVRARFVEQQQTFLDQLLARHAAVGGQEASTIEGLIERVSQRIERHLR